MHPHIQSTHGIHNIHGIHVLISQLSTGAWQLCAAVGRQALASHT